MLRLATALMALLLVTAAPAWSDPGKYPEYAKVKPSKDIEIQYIHVEELVQHVLDRKPLLIVDVRQPRSYAEEHIKGAVSIPLGAFYRGSDLVPKEGLVVLY